MEDNDLIKGTLHGDDRCFAALVDRYKNMVMAVVSRVVKNREEVGRIQNMLVREKLMDIFKEKVPDKVKEVTLDEFVKAVAAAKRK